MRSENIAKIALNAAKLPKFEAVNGKSWSPAFGSLVGQYSLKLAARCPVSGCWPSCYIKQLSNHTQWYSDAYSRFATIDMG